MNRSDTAREAAVPAAPGGCAPHPSSTILGVLLATLLGACATPPPAPVPVSPPPAQATHQQSEPVDPPPPAPAPPQPEPPAGPQDVQRSLAAVLDWLQAGQEEPAEAELKKVLAHEPANRQALGLMRQLREDPQVLLGRESFSYRVQPGESLSRLAQRFLGDPQLFYALARYNGIKVPRALPGGATLRIPGKAPATASTAGSGTAPVPTPAPSAGSNLVPAPAPASAPAQVAGQNEAVRAARLKAETVARQTRAARSAFAKQDLDGALRAWDAVLEADPDNRTAQLERQKVLGLKERLVRVK